MRMNDRSFYMVTQDSPKRLPKLSWYLGVGLLGALIGGTIIHALRPTAPITNAEAASTNLAPHPAPKVVALGRLEPASEVINLSAPLALEGDRLAELYVKVGEAVEAGQALAVLDSRDRLERLLAQANWQVQVAQRRLEQVKAGAERGEVAAQRATIHQLQAELSGEIAARAATVERLQADLHNAQAEFKRSESLYRAGAISASAWDAKRLALESAQAQLDEAEANQSGNVQKLQAQLEAAQATLEKLIEVMPEDIAVAKAEVEHASASAALATKELEQSLVRAPTAGHILKILTRPGEKVGDNGIVELGQTKRMMVIAEIDESDISQIQVGQSADVTSTAFSGALHGSVAEVGWAVNRQAVFSNQPGANLDSRVVEVRIALSLEDSQRVAKLSNLQVNVAIQTDGDVQKNLLGIADRNN